MRKKLNKVKTNRGEFWITISFMICTLLLCVYYTPLFENGDQFFYQKYYDEIKGVTLSQGYVIYNGTLGANEPFYFIITYIFSNLGVEKELLFTLINVILSFFLIKTFLKFKVNLLISFGFLCNFYYLVLLFSAERLKFSLLILLISFFYTRNSYKYLSYILTFFSHFQSIFVLMIVLYSRIKDVFKNIKSYASRFLVLFFIIGVVIVTVFVMRNALLLKFYAYLGDNGVVDIFKPFIFVFFSILISRDTNKSILLKFSPLLIASFLLGGERIVILCYFLFIYYAIKDKKSLNILVIITSIYFIFKGIEFLDNIVLFGNGFETKNH